jgi:hypothetical protein
MLGGQPGMTGMAGMSPMFVVPQSGFIGMPAGVELMQGGSGMMSAGTGLMPIGVASTSIHPPQQQILMGMTNMAGINASQIAGANFGGSSTVPTGLAPNAMMVTKLIYCCARNSVFEQLTVFLHCLHGFSEILGFHMCRDLLHCDLN